MQVKYLSLRMNYMFRALFNDHLSSQQSM